MKIAVLGTGIVSRVHAGKLAELGHQVVIGTRDVKKTMAETETDPMGNPPFSVWYKEHSQTKVALFAEAANTGKLFLRH